MKSDFKTLVKIREIDEKLIDIFSLYGDLLKDKIEIEVMYSEMETLENNIFILQEQILQKSFECKRFYERKQKLKDYLEKSKNKDQSKLNEEALQKAKNTIEHKEQIYENLNKKMQTATKKIAKIIEHTERLYSEFIALKNETNRLVINVISENVPEITGLTEDFYLEIENLTKNLRHQFIQLKEENIYPAIAYITNNTCAVCNNALRVKEKKSIATKGYAKCSNCGRILIVKIETEPNYEA